MIRTLRGNNGSFANLGNIALQPKSETVAAAAIRSQSPTHPASIGQTPLHQVLLKVPIIFHTPTSVSRVSSISLSNLVSQLNTSNRFVFPVGRGSGALMPTFSLPLEAGKVFDPRVTQGFATTSVKFQPYEQLTGLSQERPEIVMVTGFNPLFNKEVAHTQPGYSDVVSLAVSNTNMTDAGKYLDTQISMRSLRTYSTQTFLGSLMSRYPTVQLQISDRKTAFTNALNDLNADASFLLNLVRIIEAQKAQLDLRHDLYSVDPTQVGSLYASNYSQSTFSSAPVNGKVPLHITLATRHKPRYDFVDTLTDLGYTQNTVQTVYSSTKLWMQTLLELSYGFKSHTLQFLDMDTSYQRNDTNPSTILNPKVTRFGFASQEPTLPNITTLINLQPAEVAQAMNSIKPAFQTIYQNVTFKDEASRMAGLAQLLSNEHKYSAALASPIVSDLLRAAYSFAVQPNGNTTVFDSVVGKFGNNITDFPQQFSHALSAVAQQLSNNAGILTFETKYVEGDTGTLTPGGDFYFDQILQTDGKSFNTQNIDELVTVLEASNNNFNILIDQFNLMSQPASRGSLNLQPTQQQDFASSFLATPADLITAIKTQLLDASGNTSSMLQSDRLASVFAQARKDPGVKSALFLYVMSKVSRSYGTNVPFFSSRVQGDNTPLVDYLIALVNAAVAASVPSTRTALQFVTSRGLDHGVNTDALTPQSIATALKSGTKLTAYVIQLMSEIVSQFLVNTTAITNDHTRYTGVLDTVVMMVAFDLIITMIAEYGSARITGSHHGLTKFSAGGSSYVVSITLTNHSNAVNGLAERLQAEVTRIQQTILTVTNAMQVLGGSLKGISNYLKTPDAILRLQHVAGVLGNDPQLVQMLFSEQQIMLLASTVQNLLAASKQGIDSAVQTDPNQHSEITILDQSQVPEALQTAMYAYFGNDEFASLKGKNQKILTVGLPQGFAQRIKQKVNIQQQQKASFQNRRNDIVQVCVYKIDMVNSDIIYKPQRFLFELSRFPVRLSTAQWLPLHAKATTQDIVNAIPTLDFSQNADTSTASSITNGIEYASSVIAGNAGMKSARGAMIDDSYSFLTANQKAEILHNHVVSQLLEAYVHMMTGINLAEYTFDMADTAPPLEVSFVQTLTNTSVHNISTLNAGKVPSAVPIAAAPTEPAPAGGVLFSTTLSQAVNSANNAAANALAATSLGAQVAKSFGSTVSSLSGLGGFVTPAANNKALQPANSPATPLAAQETAVSRVDDNLASLNARSLMPILSSLQTISSFSDTLSTVSDPTSVNQKVVTPKQFDRVFNVMVDPTAFEVDVAKTTSTPYGREALALMIKDRDIVPVTENDQAVISINLPVSLTPVFRGLRPHVMNLPAPNINSYQYRDRDITQGDLIADKYFVTVETLDEGTT